MKPPLVTLVYDAEDPPIGAFLHALDVQLAEKEALMVCCMGWWLGGRLAALSWSRSGPPRCLSWLFGTRPSSWFGSVPGSGPVKTGRLFWYTVGQAGNLATSLRETKVGCLLNLVNFNATF